MLRLLYSLIAIVLLSPPEIAHAEPRFVVDAKHPAVATHFQRFTRGDLRRGVAEGLRRLSTHRTQVEATFTRHGVPRELIAIALVESKFKNVASRKQRCCAGVWQLNKGTARAYGLRVDSQHDERRDLAKATNAVARHLADLHDEFGDWPSAVIAYNTGSGKLRTLYAGVRHTDAWELLRRRKVSPFLAKVAAMSLVLKRSRPN